MPAKQSSERQLVAEVALLLGAKPGASPASVTRDSLAELTQKQLVNASKKLGLVSVSKLKKDELAIEVWTAWKALLAQEAVAASAEPVAVGTLATVEGAGRAAWPAAPKADGLNGVTAAVAAPASVAERVAAKTGEETVPPRSHKFEVGQADRPDSAEAVQLSRAAAREIPWGYGHDRVTAMPIDPDRFFAYWEVLDESIERARVNLGRGGASAWLNLRVYDVSGRIFDGTNAHNNFDHRLERGDRQWFFFVGRPTSELIVEIGLKSDEGYFVKIARSGRVEFPRREPVGGSEPEWLTVRLASGHLERAGSGMPGRPARPSGPGPAAVGGPSFARDGAQRGEGALGHLWRGPHSLEAVNAAPIPAGAQTMTWEEVSADGTLEVHRQFRWDGPLAQTSWEAGPFAYPVEVPEPVRETVVGRTRVFRMGAHTHVVYGPWQVTIRGLGADQSRTVLSRWEVYRSWGEERGQEVEETSTRWDTDPVGGSERMVGASGRRWVGSSELRFAGGSEQYFLKASELRLGGSSERLLTGASEWRARGASERRLGGASEFVARGSSERLFAGGSDRWARTGVAIEPPAAGVFGPSGVMPAPVAPSAPPPPQGYGASAYPAPPSGPPAAAMAPASTPAVNPAWRASSSSADRKGS